MSKDEYLDHVFNNNVTYDGVIEKILNDGAEKVSEPELLVLLLGARGSNSSKLIHRLMKKYNCNTLSLCKAEDEEILGVEGMNTETLAKVRAIGAMSSCINFSTTYRTTNLTVPSSIKCLLSPKLGFIKHVEYYAIFMNRKHDLIKYVKISQGGYSQAIIDKQLVLREALLCNAHYVTIAHNQPDGIMEPSDDDLRQTLELAKACETIGIVFYDHVVIEDGLAYYSYRLKDKL